MSTITITKLYDQIAGKWGKETVEDLCTFTETKIQSELKNLIPGLATKEDIVKLEVKISESKNETIRWMFVFWIGQMAAIFGFILLFLKK